MPLTVHSRTLQVIVALVPGEEELEVSFGILDAPNFIFIIDEVAIYMSV